MNLSKLKEVSKKKVATVTLAGALVVGSVSGGAYAYKDAWTAKIDQGVQLLAKQAFPSIATAVNDYGVTKESQFRGFVTTLITSTQSKIEAFKVAEIKRAKEEIDAHDADNRAKLDKAASDAVQKAKDAQTAKTNENIAKETGDLDKIVEDTLGQLPK